MGAPEPDDAALFDAWCEGDQAAGLRLFRRHYPSIARFFANKASRDAEDLTQRTFLACVESRANFRKASSFRTFLFGVARMVLLRWLRERARQDAHIDFDSVSAVDLAPGPSTIVGERREQQALVEALRRLPLHFQEVLELFYWEDLRAAEIAEVVGITEANVRNRLHRGKQLLADALAALIQDPQARARATVDLDGLARSIVA